MDKKKSYYERKRVKRFLSDLPAIRLRRSRWQAGAKGPYILSWEDANFLASFLVFAIISTLFSGWLAILLIALAFFSLNFWLYRNYLDSLINALIITEIFWVMLFLAIGPLTISAILLILSYTLWQLRSKKKKILLDIIFASTAIALLLLTNKWS